MNVFFTTVVRRAPLARGGEVVCVDWDAKRVVERRPLTPALILKDPNPRGNGRGGRGIARLGAELYVATYHTLLVFDCRLSLRREVDSNLFVGLHEVCADGDRLWVAATAIDAALLVDAEGVVHQSFWPRESRSLQQRFGLSPMAIDKSADNRARWLHDAEQKGAGHTHLNAVAVFGGQRLALLNRLGVVCNVSDGSVLIEDPRLRGAHNLVPLGDRLAINDSFGMGMWVFDTSGRLERRLSIADFPEVAAIRASAARGGEGARPIFVRGLSRIGDERVLVGISPATILEIDLATGKLEGMFRYSDDVAVCVHGLSVWA